MARRKGCVDTLDFLARLELVEQLDFPKEARRVWSDSESDSEGSFASGSAPLQSSYLPKGQPSRSMVVSSPYYSRATKSNGGFVDDQLLMSALLSPDKKKSKRMRKKKKKVS